MAEDDRGASGSWPPHDPNAVPAPGPGAAPSTPGWGTRPPGGPAPGTAPPPSNGVPAAPPSAPPVDAPPPPPPVNPPQWMPPPPSEFGGGPVPQPSAVPPRWRSLRGLVTALTILLWVAAADALFGAIAYANRVHFINDVLHGNVGILDAGNRADNADNLVGAAVGILALVSLAILVLFIIWMWRAAKNNEALGRLQPRLGPGWSIGGWFIPFANLVIPVLILQDLWRGADPAIARGDPRWRTARGSGLVGWYWAAFLLSLLRSGFVGRDSAHVNVASQMRGLRDHDVAAAIGMIFTIAAAVLAVMVIRRLSERQEDCLRAQQAAWNAAQPGV